MEKTWQEIMKEVRQHEDPVVTILKKAGGIDEYLDFIMTELEKCDDILENVSLSPAMQIHWSSRKETLLQLRDNYCNLRK